MAEITPQRATKGGANNDAEEAIDRDLSTISSGPWIKLEFDKTYLIDKIIIYFRFTWYWYDPDAWCARKSNFKGCVDNANNVDVSVYQGDIKQGSCGKLQLTYNHKQQHQIYTLVCNIRGNAVKLTKSDSKGSTVNLAEIVVIQSQGKTLKRDVNN